MAVSVVKRMWYGTSLKTNYEVRTREDYYFIEDQLSWTRNSQIANYYN